jgi:hypothetical protein
MNTVYGPVVANITADEHEHRAAELGELTGMAGAR